MIHTYGDDVREIMVLVMEVDKVADEVTDMEIDKQTDMVVNITNEEFTGVTGNQGSHHLKKKTF